MAQATLTQAVKAAGYGGWDFDEPVEKVQYIPSNIPGEKPTAQPTGVYTVNVTDPTGKYNKQIELRKAPHAPGTGQEGPGGGWIVAEAPDLPKPAAADAVKTVELDGTIYQYDPAKPEGQQWFPVVQGNVAKTAKTQAEFDDMRQNEAAGRGFMSTLDYQKLQQDATRTGITGAELQEKIRQNSQTNEREWATERRLGSVAAADIERTQAQTRQVGAQTAGTEVETEVNREKLRQLVASGPAAERQAILNNEVTEAQLEKYKQDLRKPSIEQLGTGPTYGVMTPQGTIEERIRQGYVPKTLGEVQARTGQLDALQKQKGAEIQARVDAKTITAEQGFAEFNSWYDQNITPQVGALEAAREEALYARGKEQATQRQQALQQAQLAGNAVTDAYRASGLSRVGSGMADALKVAGRGAGALKDVDWQSAVFVPTDDPGSVANRARAATDAAYQQVQGNQPQQAGGAQYTPLSPQAELERTRYMRAAAPAVAPAMAPPPAPAAVGGPAPEMAPPVAVADPWDAWRQRQAEDAALQQRQGEIWAEHQAAQAYVPPPVEEYEAAVAPYQPATPWAAPRPPVRRRPMPVPAPAPVGNMDVDFAPGSLPTPAYPVAPPVYDPAAEGYPMQPIWSPGGYAPPNYLYGGQYATPTPY